MRVRKRDGRITERHVQAIWYDGELRPPLLRTSDGTEVRVVYPGEWNSLAGPDFRNAVLELGADRQRVVGDVEVHLSPADWRLHGHGADPAYRQVVAHVTWRDGVPPRSLPGGAVSIWLGRCFAEDAGFSVSRIDTAAYPFGRMPSEERPCRREFEHNPEPLRRIVADAGRYRIETKAERMRGLLAGADPMQVYYAEVMGSLGYAGNAEAFRAVARFVPLEALVADPENAAAALCAAGMFAEWSRSRSRPNNAPARRLAAAAGMFTETDVLALADATDFSSRGCRAMLRTLTAGGRVGRGRAAAILANVIVPYALARGRAQGVPEWLPPEDLPREVRRVACRLFGLDHNPRACYAANGVMIQGLLRIGRECCGRFFPDCRACTVVAP